MNSAPPDRPRPPALKPRTGLVTTLTQRFIDQLPGTVFLKDSQLRLLMVNQNLGRLLGVDPQTLLGKTNDEIFPPDFASTITALDQRMLAKGGNQTVEEAFNGRHFETSMFVMTDESGEQLLGGLSVDVTERHHAAELTHALLRLNELGDQLSEKDFLTAGLELTEQLTQSAMGFLHFVNEDQETLSLGTWTAGALHGCTAAYDSHYPISQAGIWADCFRQKKAVVFNDYASYPAKAGLPQGHTVLTRLISVPVMEGDQVRMMLGVGNKTTDYDEADVDTLRLIGNDLWRIASRARAQAALKLRVDELVALNQQLAQTQLQLLQSEKMASIGQLAAGVAHEINNPIGFVKSNFSSLGRYVDDLLGIASAYAAVETQLGAPFAEAFKAVQARKQAADHDFLVTDLPQLIAESRDGVDRVSKIVQDLKAFSHTGDTEWQWSDLQAGLESTLGVVWNQLKYKAEVTRDWATLPPVYCLISQINQVVLNLLVNAAQAITEHGHIALRTGTDGSDVWIEVQDDGCGMETTQIARIFEPFYTSKPVGQGTGLGLSIAWGIVERHQGHIQVQSQLQQGSTFRVTLPIDHRLGPAGVTA
jgi:PAS domain S-box-containing protein